MIKHRSSRGKQTPGSFPTGSDLESSSVYRHFEAYQNPSLPDRVLEYREMTIGQTTNHPFKTNTDK
jgi:hypothetical protein